MMRATFAAALLSLAAGPQDSKPQPPRVPAGFTIEKVGSADLSFPMFACTDDRGRLYVTESSGGDLYVELEKLVRQCRVKRLEDADGDGRYEKSTVFAENLTPSMGLAWRDGKLTVADPPDLAVLEDTDGDGRADRRTVIQTDFGHKDNGSLHGLVFGPDGWLYGTMGQPDGYKLRRRDGTFLTGASGILFRCRPDGSDPEVLARGFENLVEVAFLPQGEIVGTCNWYQKPTGGIRDAIVHLVDGGLYPYVPDRGTPLPVTGGFVPPLALFPAVAVSGTTRLRGAAFPEEMRGNLFTAQHNSRKVMRHVLVREGSSFRSEDHDFVTSDDPDFHPSDVLEDADGSLLVVDTGAWYVQHCPTGRIRNSRSPGGIYRVRRAGAPAVEDPWGLKFDWTKAPEAELVRLLADPRPAVQDRAQRALVERGEAARPALAAAASPLAVWALGQIPGDGALDDLRRRLPNPVAARALALRADRAAAPQLAKLLSSDAAPIRLAAAEALARCGTGESLLAVWQALAGASDRFLEHALIHAAHRIAGPASLVDALEHPHPRVQTAALVLLEQPAPEGAPRPGAPREAVLRRLSSTDPELRRAALRVLQRRKEWASETVLLVQGWLRRKDLSEDEQQALRSSILAFQADATLQRVVSEAFRDGTPWGGLLISTIAETSLPRLPDGWKQRIGRALPWTVAMQAITALEIPDFDDELARIAASPDDPSRAVTIGGTWRAVRVAALRALIARRPALTEGSLDLLVSALGAGAPLDRLAAAEVLGRARLTDAQAARALSALRGDPLLPPTQILPGFKEATGAEGSIALADEIVRAVREGWRPAEAELAGVLERLHPEARERAAAARELLRKGGEEQRAKLEKFRPLLEGGNAALGRQVFFGKKVACGACHAVGSEGGRIGPDLTKVGAIRAGRDLLESILVPASTFAQGYETFLVATADGNVLSGTIARQDTEALVLRDASGAETRIRRDKVRDMKRGATSIMPEGLERNLSTEEFRDLLAYLQSLK
jgi:putative membrane-bound dehydrogenase-like protein